MTVVLWKWKSLSCDWLFVTPWNIVHGILQARILEWEPRSLALQADFFFYQLSHKGSPCGNFVVQSEIRKVDSSSFILLSQGCFGYSGVFYFTTRIVTFFVLVLWKNAVDNLIKGKESEVVQSCPTSPQPRDWTRVSHIVGRCFTGWATI